MGIESIALDYMMDNGLADDSPKTGLAKYSPGSGTEGGLLAQNPGNFFDTNDRPNSTIGTQMHRSGLIPPRLTLANQPGHDFTSDFSSAQSFPSQPNVTENNTLATTVSTIPKAAANESGSGANPPNAVVAPRPWLRANPDGSLSFGDNVHLRWHTLPPPGNDAIASILALSLDRATQAGKIAGGLLPKQFDFIGRWGIPFLGEQGIKEYLDKNFAIPWFEYDPPQQQPSDTPPNQEQAPQESTKMQELNL